MSDKRKFYLDAARSIAILSISMNHAVNRTYENFEFQYYEYIKIPHISTLIKVIAIIFGHIGVPLFLMISGALLLHKSISDEEGVKKFYRHNFLPLFVTTEIWYIIMYWFIVRFEPNAEQTGIQGMFSTILFINQTTMDSMWYMAMILCVYLIIPLLCIVVQRVSWKAFALPITIIFVHDMLIPTIHSYFKLEYIDMRVHFALRADHLFSKYLLYLLAGYWVSCGGLKKLKNRVILAGSILPFIGCCAFQYYGCTRPVEFAMDYDFPLLLVCTVFLFELIRRYAYLVKRLERPITYLSKISLGIYFVHILIMSLLEWYLDYSSWYRPVAMLFLEAVSIGGSIIIIAVLSKIPVLKRYLFLIKG